MATRGTKAPAQRMRVVPTPQPEPQAAPLAPDLEETSWLNDDMYNFEKISPALQMIYSEMGIVGNTETTIHVSKLDALGKGEEAGVWRGNPEDYNLELIARDHGTGKYRVKLYIKNGEGGKPLKGMRVFNWKLSPADELVLQRRNEPAQQPYVTMEQMQSMFRSFAQEFKPQPAPQTDTLQMMQAMAGLFTQMMPKPVEHTPTDPMKVLELALRLRDEMTPAETKSSQSNTNGNDVVVAMVDSFGPAIGAIIMDNINRNKMQNGEPQMALPNNQQQLAVTDQVQAAPAESQTGQEVPGASPQAVQALRTGITFLTAQAQAGNPVETYAELVIDNVPIADLQQLLAQPDPVSILAGIVPEVAKNQEWFVELLDNVKKLLSDNQSEADDDGP